MRKHEGIQLKFAMVGAPAVGKSALLVKFLTGRFIGEYIKDRSIIYCHRCTVLNKSIQTEFHDLCANDGYSMGNSVHALLDRYDLDGAIIVYDVNTEHTLAVAKNLAHDMDRVGLPYITIANKIDLEAEKSISNFQRYFHFRLSAKESRNSLIEDAFAHLYTRVIKSDNSFSITKMPRSKRRKNSSRDVFGERLQNDNLAHKQSRSPSLPTPQESGQFLPFPSPRRESCPSQDTLRTISSKLKPSVSDSTMTTGGPFLLKPYYRTRIRKRSITDPNAKILEEIVEKLPAAILPNESGKFRNSPRVRKTSSFNYSGKRASFNLPNCPESPFESRSRGSSIDGDVRRSSHSSRSSMMWGSLIDKLRKKSSSSTSESLTAPNSPRSPRSPTSRAFNHFPQNLPDSEMSDVSSMCSIASSQYSSATNNSARSSKSKFTLKAVAREVAQNARRKTVF